MMEAVAGVAAEFDLPCQVSLETPMACGIGICFTCVAAIATKDGWDYRRTCIEGPVFNAADVVWDTTK
jgi:dihydroorotate dehydrogenase electron transfer subunit